MADYVDNLTDNELRMKLTEYGFPMLPITGTTRKVMTKKLKLLIENKSKVNADARRSLSKYSSEEESDTDVKSRKDKNRRATIAAAPSMQPPQVNRRKSAKFIAEPVVEKETKSVTRRSTRVVKATTQDDFDTGSDSEPEIINDSISSDDRSRNNLSNHDNNVDYSRRTNVSRTTIYSSGGGGASSSRASRSPISSSVYPTLPDADSGLEKLNQIRSRLSLGGSTISSSSSIAASGTFSRKATAAGDAGGGVVNPTETPFLSNFTRRLSQLSGPSTSPAGSVAAGYNSYDAAKSDIIKEHDTNGSSPSYGRSYLSRAVRNRDISREFQTSQEKNIFKNNLVSFTLIGVAIIFFIFIFVMYVGIRSDRPAIPDVSDIVIPYCLGLEGEDSSKRGVSCLSKEDSEGGRNLLMALKPELLKRAVVSACYNKSVTPYMTDEDILSHIINNFAVKKASEIRENLNSLQLLVFHNPDWGISIVPTDKSIVPENALKNMDELLQSRQSTACGMITFNPVLPTKCRFLNTVYSIFYVAIVTLIILVTLLLSERTYRYIKKRQKEKSDQIFFMVEKIIDILQANSENSENYLAVNHIRDLLISPAERKQMQGIWNGAVTYIDESESRVRSEYQRVQGEEFHVWRWIGSPSLNTSSSSPKSRTWQGQAFETQAGSVNSLPCSPTPCLKIRGMVDERDTPSTNYSLIRMAVLNKCASKCRILHCAADSQSGCVYLKCADQNDAAVAYRNLHGWWYSGHLVTAKYLRLERYMQRFPDSPSEAPYLKAACPDGDLMS